VFILQIVQGNGQVAPGALEARCVMLKRRARPLWRASLPYPCVRQIAVIRSQEKIGRVKIEADLEVDGDIGLRQDRHHHRTLRESIEMAFASVPGSIRGHIDRPSKFSNYVVSCSGMPLELHHANSLSRDL